MRADVVLAYDPNNVKPGWIALILVVVLAVATYLLWRSMNTQLRKIQMPPEQGGTADRDGSAATERPPEPVDGSAGETPADPFPGGSSTSDPFPGGPSTADTTHGGPSTADTAPETE